MVESAKCLTVALDVVLKLLPVVQIWKLSQRWLIGWQNGVPAIHMARRLELVSKCDEVDPICMKVGAFVGKRSLPQGAHALWMVLLQKAPWWHFGAGFRKTVRCSAAPCGIEPPAVTLNTIWEPDPFYIVNSCGIEPPAVTLDTIWAPDGLVQILQLIFTRITNNHHVGSSLLWAAPAAALDTIWAPEKGGEVITELCIKCSSWSSENHRLHRSVSVVREVF